jgi:hypothetical protein
MIWELRLTARSVTSCFFRQRFDRFYFPDQDESMRPRNDAGQQESDDDVQPHPLPEVKHGDGQQDDHQDVVKEKWVHFLFPSRFLESRYC